MIDVSHHKCVWTRNRTTEIRFSGDSFSGAGVPLNVILCSFSDMNLVWFSIMFGEYGDNILLQGLPRPEAESLVKIQHSNISPVEKVLGKDRNFEEYVLSSEVRQALGISLETGQTSVTADSQRVNGYQVSIHDDCFFNVKPVDKELLRKLVQGILEQHSYYLGSEVDWSLALSPIIEEANKSKKLRFKSKPSKRMLTIRSNGGLVASIKSLFADKHDISIKNGKAYFKDSTS